MDRSAPEQPYLFEALRELLYESCLDVAGSTLRIGLAASHWQLEQARLFLEKFQSVRRAGSITPSTHDQYERVVALALHVSPRQQRAQGVITLRRDNPAGLQLDQKHGDILNTMRARGAQLVEVEHLAFDRQTPFEAMLDPMIQALAGTIKSWGTTDILAECLTADAGFYCGQLGFKRLQKRPGGNVNKVLLHLPAQRIARLHERKKQKPGNTGL